MLGNLQLYIWGVVVFKMILITKHLVPGTDLGEGAPFFKKMVIRDWYWVPIWGGGGVNTSGYMESRVGTRWINILEIGTPEYSYNLRREAQWSAGK